MDGATSPSNNGPLQLFGGTPQVTGIGGVYSAGAITTM
jgi:hypothetical protein